MVESKRKHLGEADLKSNNNAMENSSNIIVDSDFCAEDGWMIVKKQKVNILIPRLPSIKHSTVPILKQDQLPGNKSCNVTNTSSELPPEKPAEVCHAESNDGSMAWSPKSNTQSSTKVNSPADNAVSNPSPSKPGLRRLASEDQVGALRSFSGKPETHLKSYKTSPMLVRPSMFSEPSVVCNLSTSTINFNKKIRASNLERNISSAGGMSRWLSSLGLEQFEGIFRARNVNKYHLVDLSMKKLKDMGAHAVGPRRKLIHAIECVSQPTL